MKKDLRLRDVVHGLIVFRATDPIDRIAWELINAPEFQRLRRIRQLGFSEFVFPGATHTRFSHCIGVYHIARQLLERIGNIGIAIDRKRAKVTLLAALLHDIGHGPYSHAFERVQEELGINIDHESWSGNIIEGDTKIREILDKDEQENLAFDVASLIRAEEPVDIYATIVSSQFDADRLDYLQRDRYMTGTGLGAFDFDWLLDCLEVDKTTTGDEQKRDIVEVDCLCLNHKGLQAAEEYLLARFHLYSQVYLHKTTRSAEKMLIALIRAVANKVRSKDWKACPIPSTHPVARFLGESHPRIEDFMMLDDFAIWGALRLLVASNDTFIADLADRLIHRRLFKCFEASARAGSVAGNLLDRMRIRLRTMDGEHGGLVYNRSLLTDEASVSAYSIYDFGERDSLRKVLVRAKEGGTLIDVADHSSIVKGIGRMRVERYYVPDKDGLAAIERLWDEVAK